MHQLKSSTRRAGCLLPISAALAIVAAPGPQAAAATEWTDTRTVGPLVCRADFSLQSQQDLLADLTRLQDDLTRLLAVPAAKQPIELYLFHDEATYAAYLKRYLPGVPFRRALYVKLHGVGMVFAYRSRQMPIDVRHECTHALLHAVLPEVPLWLDEGLASYFELPLEQRAYDNSHLKSTQWRLHFLAAPVLESLERRTRLDDMGAGEYRDAWAWVHFMLHGPAAAHQALSGYLDDLRTARGGAPLSERLRGVWSDPRQPFAAHFAEWQR